MKDSIVQMLGISLKSYYNWKNSRLIITFLEKYFSESELQEFLETQKIKKLELIKGFTTDELENLLFNRNNNSEEQLIDYVEHNLDLEKIKKFSSIKDFFSVDIKDFLYFFQKINEENINLKLEDAKKFVLDKIQNDFYNPTIFGIFKATTKHHQKSLYQLIDENYSNVEVYVLVKKNIKLK
jgi:hypothetical protein